MGHRLFFTEELIEMVYQYVGADDTGAIGTSKAEIMRYLSDGLLSQVVPIVLGLREDFFTVSEHVALVGGQTDYDIPRRAIGLKLASVKWVDQTPTPNERHELRRIIPEDNARSQFIGQSSRSALRYFLRSDQIVLAGTDPTADGFLELDYYFQPGEFIQSTGYRKILLGHDPTDEITDGSMVIDTSARTTDTEFVIGEKVDIHAGDGSGVIKAWDLTLSAATEADSPIGTNGLGVPTTAHTAQVSEGDTALDGSAYGRREVVNGDYLVPAGRAAVPMFLPRNAHPFVAEVASLLILGSFGDEEAARTRLAIRGRLEDALVLAHDDRVEGAPQRFTTNRGVWGRGGGIRRCRSR